MGGRVVGRIVTTVRSDSVVVEVVLLGVHLVVVDRVAAGTGDQGTNLVVNRCVVNQRLVTGFHGGVVVVNQRLVTGFHGGVVVVVVGGQSHQGTC